MCCGQENLSVDGKLKWLVMLLKFQVFLILQEKKAAELAPSTNSIRRVIGPSSTIVLFLEDVGLVSLFNPRPIRLIHTPTFLPFCRWPDSFRLISTPNIQIVFLDIRHHEKSMPLRHAPICTNIVVANPMFLSTVFNVTKLFMLHFLLLQHIEILVTIGQIWLNTTRILFQN